MSTPKEKDHADFQSKYRQSSNFNDTSKDEGLTIASDGYLKLDKNPVTGNMSESDKKKISYAMDSMKERIEQTPGGKQTGNKNK